MKRKNRKTILTLFGCVAGAVLSITACDEESDVTDKETRQSDVEVGKLKGMGPYAVLSYAGDSSTFIGVLDSLTGGDYTLAKAQEVDAMGFAYHAGKLYAPPSFSGGGTDIEIYKITDSGELVPDGKLPVPSGAKPMDMLFVDDDRAYISLLDAGVIWELDLNTLEPTAEIDLTEYAVDDGDSEDNSPEPTNLAVKDDKLYVTLSQSYNQAMMARDGVYVAVIDMETNTVERIIEDLDRGFSYAGRMSGTFSGTSFVDENGDLYVGAVGSWGWAPGQNAGYLRIRAGETEFDPDWEIDLAEHEIKIDGETVIPGYLNLSIYAGDGIVYGAAHIPAHDSNPPDWVNDKNCSLVKVDLYNQTVEALPLPSTNLYGSSMTMDNGLLVAPLFTDAGDGVYVYDPATGDAVTEPVIQTEGTIGFIRKID